MMFSGNSPHPAGVLHAVHQRRCPYTKTPIYKWLHSLANFIYIHIYIYRPPSSVPEYKFCCKWCTVSTTTYVDLKILSCSSRTEKLLMLIHKNTSIINIDVNLVNALYAKMKIQEQDWLIKVVSFLFNL